MRWNRTILLERRRRHKDIDEMFKRFARVQGIYFIGREDKIIYIGQSLNIADRSLESLSHFYRINDIELSWSIGIAISQDEDLNELESSAIRKYNPLYNTSIPSIVKSKGRLPKISHIFRVFGDMEVNCSAFNSENLKRQSRDAENNLSPHWQK